MLFISSYIKHRRTDSGVHAFRNVGHFDLGISTSDALSSITSSKKEIPNSYALLHGLNYYLSPNKSGLCLTDVEEVADNFDARHNATARTYMYRILNYHRQQHSYDDGNNLYNREHKQSQWSTDPQMYRGIFHSDRAWTLGRPLDVEAMYNASRSFVGIHDFASFQRSTCQSAVSIRDVHHIDILLNNQSVADAIREDKTINNNLITQSHENMLYSLDINPAFANEIKIVIKANSFLQTMVRNIVSVLTRVGAGDMRVEDMVNLLEIKDRSKINIPPAPAHGLYLVEVHYDGKKHNYQEQR